MRNLTLLGPTNDRIIYDAKRTNPWGRYIIYRTDTDRVFRAVRRERSKYTGKLLRGLRQTHR